MRAIERSPSHTPRRFFAATSMITLLCALGCIEGGPGDSFSSVNGTVRGESFQMFSGVAERSGSSYIITITDSSGYTCSSTPSSRYLQVTWFVEQVGTVSAADANVTFSSAEGNVNPSEFATSGDVSITEIDETQGFISGSIFAQGSDSDISGSFDVDICP